MPPTAQSTSFSISGWPLSGHPFCNLFCMTGDPTPGTDWTLAALRADLHGFSAFYLLLLLVVGGGRGKLEPKASTC